MLVTSVSTGVKLLVDVDIDISVDIRQLTSTNNVSPAGCWLPRAVPLL